MKWLIAVLFVAACLLLAWVSRPPPEEVGRTTIRYMAWGNPEQLATEEELIREFERRHPTIHVRLTLVPGSAYYQKLQVMLASGTATDVFRCDHYQFPAYAKRRHFMPLTDFVAGDPDFRLADYFEQAILEGQFEGQFYGPNVLYGTRVIYYNRDAFAREGLPDPYELYRRGEWTLEQFVAAARRLTRSDGNGMATHFGVMVHPMDIWTFAWAFGGDIMTPDGSRCVADQPATVRALQFMQDLRHVWHVMPTPAESALNAYTFESGKIAMVFGWAGESPRYRQFIKDFQWDVVPVPKGPAGRFSQLKGNQLLMYNRTRHAGEAWAFIKFYVSRDAEAILCGRLRRAMPTRRDYAASPEYLQTDRPPFHSDVWVDQYAMGRPLPITDRWFDWQAEWSKQFELLMLNRITPAEMASDVTTRVNEILAEEPY